MKVLYKFLAFVALAGVAACTEDIIIDVEEGEPMIGVEASFTDELKGLPSNTPGSVRCMKLSVRQFQNR